MQQDKEGLEEMRNSNFRTSPAAVSVALFENHSAFERIYLIVMSDSEIILRKFKPSILIIVIVQKTLRNMKCHLSGNFKKTFGLRLLL